MSVPLKGYYCCRHLQPHKGITRITKKNFPGLLNGLDGRKIVTPSKRKPPPKRSEVEQKYSHSLYFLFTLFLCCSLSFSIVAPTKGTLANNLTCFLFRRVVLSARTEGTGASPRINFSRQVSLTPNRALELLLENDFEATTAVVNEALRRCLVAGVMQIYKGEFSECDLMFAEAFSFGPLRVHNDFSIRGEK